MQVPPSHHVVLVLPSPSSKQRNPLSLQQVALLGQKDLGRLGFGNTEGCCTRLGKYPTTAWEKNNSCSTAVQTCQKL